jgi:peroxiredoxin
MKQLKRIGLVWMMGLAAATVQAQVRVGQLAPEIALPNAKDSVVKLSSFKGKVVLLDFWASWCYPCRESIPGVVKLYNKYKTKGFEVVAVSIDSKKSEWKKASKYFKLPYTSLLDPLGWNAPVINTYGIGGIPATYLLDKEGRIVAIDEEGPALEAAIKALL